MIQSPIPGLSSLLIALNLSPTINGVNEVLQPLIDYASKVNSIPGLDSPNLTAVVNYLVIQSFIRNFIENLLIPNLSSSVDILTNTFIQELNQLNQQPRLSSHL